MCVYIYNIHSSGIERMCIKINFFSWQLFFPVVDTFWWRHGENETENRGEIDETKRIKISRRLRLRKKKSSRVSSDGGLSYKVTTQFRTVELRDGKGRRRVWETSRQNGSDLL